MEHREHRAFAEGEALQGLRQLHRVQRMIEAVAEGQALQTSSTRLRPAARGGRSWRVGPDGSLKTHIDLRPQETPPYEGPNPT